MKEQFIASISHEMRTPMNAILGMSNLVSQTELSGEQTNLVSAIKQSSEILLGVINDIDKLDAIFETFTRIRNKDRLYEGTGLGLSIAKNLVEQQGGKIGVKSVFGQGSTFFFDLAFEKGDALDVIEIIEKEENLELKNDGAIRLLLVEDHKMNQLVAKKTLTKKWEKIHITIANNGQEAVEVLEKNTATPFDIILMDIQMPIMDGYEATDHIRNKMTPELAAMPILAMTAHAHISKGRPRNESRYARYASNGITRGTRKNAKRI